MLPRRQRLPHELPGWVPDGSLFFITIKCQPAGRNQLVDEVVSPAILATARQYHEQGRWFCRVFLLMPDHLHAVLAFPPQPGMKTTVSHWKRFVARQHGTIWQRDFFDHRLRTVAEEEETVDYIRMNPVRKGLVVRPEDWPWVYRPDDRLPPQWRAGEIG